MIPKLTVKNVNEVIIPRIKSIFADPQYYRTGVPFCVYDSHRTNRVRVRMSIDGKYEVWSFVNDKWCGMMLDTGLFLYTNVLDGKGFMASDDFDAMVKCKKHKF